MSTVERLDVEYILEALTAIYDVAIARDVDDDHVVTLTRSDKSRSVAGETLATALRNAYVLAFG
jgi:hypothetical protein